MYFIFSVLISSLPLSKKVGTFRENSYQSTFFDVLDSFIKLYLLFLLALLTLVISLVNAPVHVFRKTSTSVYQSPPCTYPRHEMKWEVTCLVSRIFVTRREILVLNAYPAYLLLLTTPICNVWNCFTRSQHYQEYTLHFNVFILW